MSGRQFVIFLIVGAAAAFVGGMAAVRMVTGKSVHRSMSAQEYHLTDIAGVKRASFSVSLIDEPALVLRDKDGKQRAILSFTESGGVYLSAATTDSLPGSGNLITLFDVR